MGEKAKKLRAEYQRKYKQENKEKLNKYRREWAKNNPDKIKEYQKKYWEKKAAEEEQLAKTDPGKGVSVNAK